MLWVFTKVNSENNQNHIDIWVCCIHAMLAPILWCHVVVWRAVIEGSWCDCWSPAFIMLQLVSAPFSFYSSYIMCVAQSWMRPRPRYACMWIQYISLGTRAAWHEENVWYATSALSAAIVVWLSGKKGMIICILAGWFYWNPPHNRWCRQWTNLVAYAIWFPDHFNRESLKHFLSFDYHISVWLLTVASC